MSSDPIGAYRSFDIAHDIPLEADERIQRRMFAALDSTLVEPRSDLTPTADEAESDGQAIVVELEPRPKQPAKDWRGTHLLAVAAVVALIVGIAVVAFWPEVDQVHTDDNTVANQPDGLGPDLAALREACSANLAQLADFVPADGVIGSGFIREETTVDEAQLFLASFVEELQGGLGERANLPNEWVEVSLAIHSVDELLIDEAQRAEITGRRDGLSTTLPLAARQLQDIADQLAALGISECAAPPSP